MSTLNNTSFGPYRVLAPLGAGGMGEVYRARDTRLQRDVAVKILSEEFAANPDRRARFEREARAVAALNHPNILALYDIGEERGHLYMVTELVPGETLRALVRKGPLPLRDVLDIAIQVAGGLAAAHDAGITHRDLKPENLMLTEDRAVKILDFGLARQDDAKAAALGQTDQTMTVHSTTPGAVMGTANYMSPEQARGIAVDYRADQFSFGLLVYEMLAGTRPFERETTVQTMSAILTDDPAPLDAKVPAPVRWIVERCLAKDPRQRYTSTRDLYQELRHLREHMSELSASGTGAMPAVAPAVPAARSRRWILWTVVAAGLGVCAFFAGIWSAGRQSLAAGLKYTPFAVSEERQFSPFWSPDGQAVAYAATIDGNTQIFLRYLNAATGSQVTHGKESYGLLGWSGDGKTIYITGKNPKAEKPPSAIFSLPVFGGEPEFLTALEYVIAATLSPDGKTIAILERNPDGIVEVLSASPLGAPFKKYSPSPFESKTVFSGPNLTFSPNGKMLLYCVDTTNSRQAWLLPWPAGSGTPRRIMNHLSTLGSTPRPSWLPDNRHVVLALSRSRIEREHLYLARIDSEELTPLTGGIERQTSPAVSPDGNRVLYSETRRDLNVISVSLADASVSRLIATQRIESMPAWSARQPRLVYTTDRNGPQEIWLREADGNSRPLITDAAFPPGTTDAWMTPTLSPDGNRAIFVRVDISGHERLWISSVSGSAPVRLTDAEGPDYGEFGGAWSPDGNRFTFIRFSNAKNEIAIVKTTGHATPSTLRKESSEELPDWSPTGEWISVRDKDAWVLISPDGQRKVSLGKIATSHLTFAKDGKLLYGIRAESPHYYLFSLDIATKQVKNIGDVGRDNAPTSDFTPGIRFSLTPDGKSISYSVATSKLDLYMIEGLPKTGRFW